MEGCKHFGVKEEYIDWLRSHPNQPRKSMSECKKFNVEPGMKVFTEDELKQGDGKEDRPLLIAVNGKICRCIMSKDHPKYSIFTFSAGLHADFLLAKMLYDPQFGLPSGPSDLTAH